MGWFASGGWQLPIWAMTVLSIALAGYMRVLAPSFTALQAHSFFGYHVRRMRKVLKVLCGDREKLARVNRVRKLDMVLPALSGATLIAWSLHFSTLAGAGHMVPRLMLGLCIAASLAAVGFDYLENARMGAMVDRLPAEPSDGEIRTACHFTVLKLWSYSLALLIVLADAAVYLLGSMIG